MLIPIDQIVIPQGRHRKHLGDVQALASSIAQVGLLHPLVVSPDHRLIAGARRLAALQSLGRTEAPVTVVTNLTDAAAWLRAERDENTCRLDLAPSEAVAIGLELERLERQAAKERQAAAGPEEGRGCKRTGSGKFPEPVKGQARDKAGQAVGMSGKTYAKAKAVVEAATRDPERCRQLIEEMDRTGNVDRAYKRLKTLQEQEALAAAAAALPPAQERFQLHHGDFAEVSRALPDASVDVIITDPPYPKEYLPLYGQLAQVAGRLLKPGGALLVMVGQS